jgi:ribosomal protein S18 acetylase RimI-like enzyme
MSDPAGITIRPLRTDDGPQWRVMRLEALRTYPLAFASAYEEALEQDLTARIPPPDGPSVLFGAFHDGVLSGSAGLHVWPGLKQRHKAELWGMYVAPSLHRRGVGAALLRAAIEHARTRVAVVELTVLHANTAAKALYRSFGFVSYGIERRALRHQGIDHDDELMALDLGNDQ